MKRGIYTLIGFVLVVVGIVALVLSVVGVKLSFLVFIDKPGPTFGLVVRLMMIISGFVIAVLNTTNWKEEDQL